MIFSEKWDYPRLRKGMLFGICARSGDIDEERMEGLPISIGGL
jgi:hypothetical protein